MVKIKINNLNDESKNLNSESNILKPKEENNIKEEIKENPRKNKIEVKTYNNDINTEKLKKDKNVKTSNVKENKSNIKNKTIKNKPSNKNKKSEFNNEIERQYRNLKIKKIIMSTILIIITISLVIFGTYNTFIKEEKSPQQLTNEVNAVNRETQFPSYGVLGYLKENVNLLIERNSSYSDGVKNVSINVDTINIQNIFKRNAYIANIYFSAKVETNLGSNDHNFFIALKYDYENYSYAPASELQISMAQSQNSTNIADNDVLSFDGISSVSDEQTLISAQNFINQFFIMVYNEKIPTEQLDSSYSGSDVLGDDSITFNNITEFKMYEGYNKNGYNAIVKYSVTLSEGIEYINTNYLDIQKSGKSWIIRAIL